jgi:digeranylgeranylglycerophospholipid reductase
VKCDVLVVGASAAGLMAATSAGDAGASVILLDSDFGSFHHSANTLFEGMASRSGGKVEDCYQQKELEGMRILSPSGEGVTIPAKGYFIDRQKFDQHYLRLAEDAGVITLQGTARSARADGSKRTVAIANADSSEVTLRNEGEISASVVVDASGIGSALSKQAGLRPMRHPEDIAWAMEAEVEHPNLGEEMFFQYWIGSLAPGWKATFSPAGGDRATLGVFVRGHGPDVQPFFRGVLKLFKDYKAMEFRDIEKMKILAVRRGGDPIAVLPGEIVADSFMVTGGAAGQSGLAYGMRAGQICGEVAARAAAAGDVSRKALFGYERLWKSEFYWEYRLGRAALETLMGLKDREIDRLVRGLSGRYLISGGPLPKKIAHSGAKVALVRPRTILELAWNLAKG